MQPQKSQDAQAPECSENPHKKVLVDGNTLELARQLGISLEEYVDHVVGFFIHAQEEPALYVVKAEDPRAAGRPESPEPRPTSEFQEVRCAPRRKAG